MLSGDMIEEINFFAKNYSMNQIKSKIVELEQDEKSAILIRKWIIFNEALKKCLKYKLSKKKEHDGYRGQDTSSQV